MITLSLHRKARIAAVVKKELTPLIKILGINNIFVVEDRNEVLEALNRLIKDRDVGVIVVQKSLVRDIEMASYTQDIGLYPSIVVIPDTPEELAETPRTFYRDIIRRFIGYEVYLE